MKNFTLNTIYFLLPILLIVLFLEGFIRLSTNTFNSKATHIKKNPDIELLILGSSHNQANINTAFFDLKSANLAYAMQDLQLDSALFMTQVNHLKHLKYVILELDYLTLFKKNYADYFRFPWYYIYYDINLYGTKGADKYLLYTSSPMFFNNYIIDEFKSYGSDGKTNQFGSKTTNHSREFDKLNHDEKKIKITSRERITRNLNSLSITHYNFNVSKLNFIINYALKNKIKVILISNPMYKLYTYGYKKDLLKAKEHYKDSLLTKQKDIIYFDHEYDPSFTVYDFNNEDHLNAKAAERFTKILNHKIDSVERIDSFN